MKCQNVVCFDCNQLDLLAEKETGVQVTRVGHSHPDCLKLSIGASNKNWCVVNDCYDSDHNHEEEKNHKEAE